MNLLIKKFNLLWRHLFCKMSCFIFPVFRLCYDLQTVFVTVIMFQYSFKFQGFTEMIIGWYKCKVERDERQNSLCTVGSTYHILLSRGSGTHQPFHCDYCIQTNVTNLLTNIWALEKRYNIHNIFKLHQQISIACGWVKGILCKKKFQLSTLPYHHDKCRWKATAPVGFSPIHVSLSLPVLAYIGQLYTVPWHWSSLRSRWTQCWVVFAEKVFNYKIIRHVNLLYDRSLHMRCRDNSTVQRL